MVMPVICERCSHNIVELRYQQDDREMFSIHFLCVGRETLTAGGAGLDPVLTAPA